MTPERIMLIITTVIAVGLAYDRWAGIAMRPAWWRRMDLHHAERVMLERQAATAGQLNRVAAGLHEDIDGLREELRGLAGVDPRIVRDLRWVRWAVVGLAAAVLALAGVLAQHAGAAGL